VVRGYRSSKVLVRGLGVIEIVQWYNGYTGITVVLGYMCSKVQGYSGGTGVLE